MVRIRDLRSAYGLTQEQVAERIRELGVPVTAAALSNIEKGHKKASPRLLDAWARVLNVDPLTTWHGPLRAELTRECEAVA